jgi:RimJ/RimL family protein N-acetyltransferase
MFVPTLETNGLWLRQYRPEDSRYFAALNFDAEVRRHVGGPLDEVQVTQYMEEFTSESEPTGMWAWAIEGSKCGLYVGHAWLLHQGNQHHPDVGLLISREHWGKHYGAEVVAEICRFARRELGCNEIYASVDLENVRSQAMLRRAGFEHFITEQDEDGSYLVFVSNEA